MCSVSCIWHLTALHNCVTFHKVRGGLCWGSTPQVIQTFQNNKPKACVTWLATYDILHPLCRHDWLHMTYYTHCVTTDMIGYIWHITPTVSLQTWWWQMTEWNFIQDWRDKGMLYINNLSCPSLCDEMTKWFDCHVTEQIGREWQITLATGPRIFKWVMFELGSGVILQQWFGKQDRQCTYNITLRRVLATIVVVEKQ
jgi:hypothetical protein